MLKIDYKLETEPLIKYFKKVSSKKEITKAVKKALAKVGIEIRRQVIPRTPRGEGDLVNSWKVETNDLTIEMGFDIVYAMYQHQGRRQDGSHIIINRPGGGETYFLKNAIEENFDNIMQIFADTISKELLKP